MHRMRIVMCCICAVVLAATADAQGVIFEPTTGTVSGTGTIVSSAIPGTPAALEGATFNFTARYLDKSLVPTGSTVFNDEAAELSFLSNTYDWLVVYGNRAWYGGTGVVAVNGDVQPAEFLVAIVDNAKSGGRFRMKIWTASGTIFDNQPGAPDAAPATRPVLTGSVDIRLK